MEIIQSVLTIIVSLVVGYSILFLGCLILILGLMFINPFWRKNRNKKFSKNDEFGDAREMGNQAMKDYRKTWYGNFHTTDKQYELISNMENIYKPTKNLDFDSYFDPIISDDQIIKFIKWAKAKKSKNQKSTLIDLISDQFDIDTPAVSVNFDMEVKDPGAFFCKDFSAYGFCITRFNYSCEIHLTSESWVHLLAEPKLFDWLNFSDWDYEDLWNYNYSEGVTTSYLKENNAEFIAPSDDFEYSWDYEMQGGMYELVKVEPVNDISYKDEIFEINYKKFTFLKKEREHLIILLMASYRPSVIQSIIKETP